MILSVIAHPNARKPRIEEDEEGIFHAYVHEPAQDGKANQAILASLAEFLNVKKNQIFPVKGEKSRHKVFEVLE